MTYWHGVNLCWLHWGQDFGDGPSANGMSNPANAAAVDEWLARAQDAGMQVVRWLAFPEPTYLTLDDTNHHFTIDANGLPTGFKPNVLADMDAAVELLGKRGLQLDLILFNHIRDTPRTWITEPAGRAALLAVLSTLFARYRDHVIWAWELGSEWTGELDGWNTYIDEAAVKALLQGFVETVHANCPARAAASAGSLQDLHKFVGLGLDHYNSSWYATNTYAQGEGDPTLHDYAYYAAQQGLETDKPLYISEMMAGPGDPALARYRHLHDHGYSGAWGWSATPAAMDGMRIDWDAAAAFGTIVDMQGQLAAQQARYAAVVDQVHALTALVDGARS